MSNGQLLIASKCCDQCLFGPNKIVNDLAVNGEAF